MAAAVLFDLWNTILYCPTRESVDGMIRCLGLGGVVCYRDMIAEMDKTTFIDEGYMLKDALRGLCRRYGVKPDDSAIEDAVDIWAGRLEDARYFPEAEAVLSDLAEDHKLALVSNTDSGGAEYVVEAGVDSYFDAVVMSCYVGVVKPDQRIYEYAVRVLGEEVSDCWMVGDNIECDVIGAEKAGLNAVLVDRSGGNKGLVRNVVGSLSEVRGVVG